MSVSESSAGAIENTLRSYVGLSGTVTGSTPVTESEAGAIENLLRGFTGLPQVDIQGGSSGGASLNVINLTLSGGAATTTKTDAEILAMYESKSPVWITLDTGDELSCFTISERYTLGNRIYFASTAISTEGAIIISTFEFPLDGTLTISTTTVAFADGTISPGGSSTINGTTGA